MTQPTLTPNPGTRTEPQRSSQRAAHKSPFGWLPWALLALLALLVAMVFLIFNAVDDDGPDGSAGDTLGQANSSGSGLDGQDGNGQGSGAEGEQSNARQSQPGQSQPGQSPLQAGSRDVLALSTGNLRSVAGQPVSGTAKVESVVSDEGFWVGSSPEQRVFVFLTSQARQSAGESGFQVRRGQTVQLQGTVTALSEASDAAAGVTEAEGRGQLDRQGALIQAQSVQLA